MQDTALCPAWLCRQLAKPRTNLVPHQAAVTSFHLQQLESNPTQHYTKCPGSLQVLGTLSQKGSRQEVSFSLAPIQGDTFTRLIASPGTSQPICTATRTAAPPAPGVCKA